MRDIYFNQTVDQKFSASTPLSNDQGASRWCWGCVVENDRETCLKVRPPCRMIDRDQDGGPQIFNRIWVARRHDR